MNIGLRTCRGLLLALCLLGVNSVHAELTLDQAVALAQRHDPGLRGSELRAQAAAAQGIAAAQLPDPMLSVGVANLPVDTFDFAQEPMTQLQLSVSQAFPRGDTRALKQQQLDKMSEQQRYLYMDRQAKVTLTVTQLWLESYRYRETLNLIEKNRVLFDHLVDVAEASYSSATGKTRQQDFIRAQLELTQLDDRLTEARLREDTFRSQLAAWISDADSNAMLPEFTLSEQLPVINLAAARGFSPTSSSLDGAAVAINIMPILLAHPAILALEQKVIASGVERELAQQQYKPQWGLKAGYGYREDNADSERADFFSLGLTLDMPLFTAKRQDKAVQAATASAEAMKTEKSLMLREMRSGFETARAQLLRLTQRQQLYQRRLLGETQQHAEASLTAYTNGSGEFSDAVRARISELNARIDALNIDIERLKIVAQLNYFFSGDFFTANATNSAAPDDGEDL